MISRIEGQGLIAEKLTTFLLLDKYTDRLVRPETFYNIFFDKKADPGHCFSLSVLYCVMDLTNKSPWWAAAIKEITKWDGDVNKLTAPLLSLPGSETENETLETLFIKLIIFIQISR